VKLRSSSSYYSEASAHNTIDSKKLLHVQMATAANTATACKIVAGARESAVRLLDLLKATSSDPAGGQKLAEQIIRCIDCALTGFAAVRRRPWQEAQAARPPAGSKRRYIIFVASSLE
jgi:hypothetical protein